MKIGVTKWTREHPERVRENQHRWYLANKAKVLAATRARRVAKPERIKAAARHRHLVRTFGLTLREFDEMFTKQRGVCALCVRPGPHARALNVDHDHVSGRIRALLCPSCNRALGYFGDDPVLMRAAADYVECYREDVAA
jgi:Recombination endonuclease VII